MTAERDPNQPYEPVAYPRMLYATAAQYEVVNTEAEERDARARGYTDFNEVDPARDGLEHLSLEHLIDAAVLMLRDRLVKTAIPEVVAEIRAERARLAQVGADDARTAEPDEYDVMSDDDLRSYLKERDGRSPHPATSRPKLLAKARGDVTEADE